MIRNPSNYTGVLLDATCFFAFSRDLRTFLDQSTLWVSASWEDTATAMLYLLKDTAYIGHYSENLKFLSERVKTLDNEYSNVYSDAVYLAGKRMGRYLLVTADQILIQRLVLNRVDMDIYNLREQKMVDPLLASLDFNVSPNKTTKGYQTPIQGRMNLQCTNERGEVFLLRLTGRLDVEEGSEGKIYICDSRPGQYAKIFKEEHLTVDKMVNVKRLYEWQRNDPICGIWAKVPKELLFDAHTREPVGFFMDIAEFDQNKIGSDEGTEQRLALDVVRDCRYLLAQMIYLNVFGFYIFDYNSSNFALPKPPSDGQPPVEQNYVIMMDTDSFGSEQYIPKLHDQEMNLYHKWSGTLRKVDALNLSMEMAHLFVGASLMKGYVFLQQNGSLWEADDRCWKLIPSNVAGYLKHLFRRNGTPLEQMPSVDGLLAELMQAPKVTGWDKETIKDLEAEEEPIQSPVYDTPHTMGGQEDLDYYVDDEFFGGSKRMKVRHRIPPRVDRPRYKRKLADVHLGPAPLRKKHIANENPVWEAPRPEQREMPNRETEEDDLLRRVWGGSLDDKKRDSGTGEMHHRPARPRQVAQEETPTPIVRKKGSGKRILAAAVAVALLVVAMGLVFFVDLGWNGALRNWMADLLQPLLDLWSDTVEPYWRSDLVPRVEAFWSALTDQP